MNNRLWLVLVVSGLFSMGASAGLMTYGHQSGGCGGSSTNGPLCTDTWSDSWTGGKVYLSAWGTSFWSYTFDITKDGFVAGEDTVLDYNLTFGFRDDAFDYFEYVKVYQSGVYSSSWEVDTGTRYLGGTLAGTAQLNSAGQLSVNLYSKKGDFFLTDAILNACGLDSPSRNVPEPSTFVLLVFGVVGVWLARRKTASA